MYKRQLQAKLEEAMDEGIKVSSFDSAPNKDSREIFVNQAGTKEVAQALMDAVLDISDVYKRQGLYSLAISSPFTPSSA